MAEAPDKPFMTPEQALKKYDYPKAGEDQKAIKSTDVRPFSARSGVPRSRNYFINLAFRYANPSSSSHA